MKPVDPGIVKVWEWRPDGQYLTVPAPSELTVLGEVAAKP